MEWSTWMAAAAGGVLIGAAATALLVLTGKTAGVSGVLDGLVRVERSELDWKIAFVAGLLTGGVVLARVLPANLADHALQAWPVMAIAGWLVGFGTRLGGGCTSGHGVCGIGRLSGRSIAGTLTFIATGMVTVWAWRAFAS
jgi:uncharacterized membrane protein YedE/YeeE